MQWGCVFVVVCFLSLETIEAAKTEDFDDEIDEEDYIPYAGERYDRFDWKLCSSLDEEEPGNVIASPISVKLLLVLLYEAATGETARELEKALQLKSSKSATRAHQSALLKSFLEGNSEYDLEIGIRIFIDKKLNAKHWYQRILAMFYGAFIQKIDFENFVSAASSINDWTDSATHGHIKRMVQNAEHLRESIFLLINAIYFQGRWKTPFPLENSYNGQFQSPSGPLEVRYMTQTALFYYTESKELDSKILRLPYLGRKFGMYIILPGQKDGLNQLLTRIQPFVLKRLLWQLEETSVEVTIPAFKFDYTMSLKSILEEIGLSAIFENTGDFHGVVGPGGERVGVSHVIQKASIEVSEVGTIAAAATESEFVYKMDIPELEFNASHPFLFFIEDETTGTVIFEGKLVNPEISSSKLDVNASPTPKAEETPTSSELPPQAG